MSGLAAADAAVACLLAAAPATTPTTTTDNFHALRANLAFVYRKLTNDTVRQKDMRTLTPTPSAMSSVTR